MGVGWSRGMNYNRTNFVDLPSYTNIRPISFSQVAKLENPPDKVPWQERLTCKRLKQAVQVAE